MFAALKFPSKARPSALPPFRRTGRAGWSQSQRSRRWRRRASHFSSPADFNAI